MMLANPTYYACPDCGALHERTEIASGNTFRSWLFSDGKMDAPMLPDIPFITRCHRCALIFYLDTLTRVEPLREDEASAQYVSGLGHEGYAQVVKDRFFRSDNEEMRVRLRYLWSFNDPFRKADECKDWSADKDFVGNVKRILEMMSGADENTLIFSAELNRLIGNFERSGELLDLLEEKYPGYDMKEIIQVIQTKNLVHDSRVFIIRKGEG